MQRTGCCLSGPASALAVYPVLTTTLTGPAINGVVPAGQAKVSQCHLPQQFGTLTVRVQSVHLPDGTQLTVNYGGLSAGQGVDLGRRREPGARVCRPEESVSTHNR